MISTVANEDIVKLQSVQRATVLESIDFDDLEILTNLNIIRYLSFFYTLYVYSPMVMKCFMNRSR